MHLTFNFLFWGSEERWEMTACKGWLLFCNPQVRQRRPRVTWFKDFMLKGFVSSCKCNKTVRNKASVFVLQQISTHENKSCRQASSLLPSPPLPPFLSKLFDQFDLFKQNMAHCVFRANFPLHRWRISVYFSFIFNGRPFRHWTHEPSSSCRALALSLSSPPLRPTPQWRG